VSRAEAEAALEGRCQDCGGQMIPRGGCVVCERSTTGQCLNAGKCG
jgi:hypothetical protein